MSTTDTPERSQLTGGRLEYAPIEIRRFAEVMGSMLTDLFHFLGLFAIGAATVWSAVLAYIHMIGKGAASVEDLLPVIPGAMKTTNGKPTIETAK